MMAVELGSQECVSILLANGADVNMATKVVELMFMNFSSPCCCWFNLYSPSVMMRMERQL